ncbi:MAG TPA: ATP-binding cassette domain-containing protein [Paracoccaceae bacterium]|nr:ATP-binding cassette domain-containing protein [Paracoccaceae bacterium]
MARLVVQGAALPPDRPGLVAAVRDVTLEVAPGEIFVVMGLSGSGKSTLLRCLSRLVEPTAGSLTFEGQDLRAADEAAMTQIRRHRMGMVFQHFALLPHLTVAQNVAFPLAVQGVARAEREARAAAMVALVGLDGRESAYPRELSGGQQQRVGIARSLAADPVLWFLDEPFSALDPLIRREMQDAFLRLQATLHKTIVFVTHDFDEAIRVADRIAIMKDGAIVQTGTAEDLVTRPATPYVAEFTRGVPRAKVTRLASLARPGDGDAAGAASARLTVAEAAPRFAAGSPALRLTGDDGAPAGHVLRDDVLAVLMAG